MLPQCNECKYYHFNEQLVKGIAWAGSSESFYATIPCLSCSRHGQLKDRYERKEGE